LHRDIIGHLETYQCIVHAHDKLALKTTTNMCNKYVEFEIIKIQSGCCIAHAYWALCRMWAAGLT